MRSYSAAVCCVLLFAIAASALRSFHPTNVPDEWRMREEPLPRDMNVRVMFALKQRNLDMLEKRLMEVSDPTNPAYGMHMTLPELAALIGPSVPAQAALRSFLLNNNFHSLEFTTIGDYVTARASVADIERVLSTELRSFESPNSPRPVIRAATPYVIPAEIDEIVHSVPGLHGFQYKKVSNSRNTRAATAATVSPNDIISRYQISEPSAAVAGSSQAVVEFDLNWYSPDDLQTFFKTFTPSQAGRKIVEIYGDNRPEIHVGVEANLDVQYIMGIGWNVNTTAYTMPPDSDILNSFMQYTQLTNNMTSPPLVHSISFGEYGGNYPNSTVQLIDTEFQKMGVRGVSVLVASGDNGVGCNKQCTSQEFDFPSSPYITLVGSTQFLSPNETGAKFSSGGFSRDQWRPSYQSSAVQAYLNSGVKLPPSSYYFANGRAYPDVSAVGVDISIIVNGKQTAVDGTSCSAPIFAGIVALLNNYRIQNHKSPLGFLNPLLYQNPQAFTDIITGSNPYLCCPGFEATTGWDPVTGLGTPVYPKLLSVVQKLP